MALGLSRGRMARHFRAHSWKTISMALASTSGRTVESILASGKITEWTVAEFFRGVMDAPTTENTATTSRMDTVFSDGQMAAVMRASGWKGSNTALERIPRHVDRSRLANGTKGGGRGGFPANLITSSSVQRSKAFSDYVGVLVAEVLQGE